jgi:hypothetical protein
MAARFSSIDFNDEWEVRVILLSLIILRGKDDDGGITA